MNSKHHTPAPLGFVYVLTNRAMPGFVKIGMTTRLAEDRAGELSRTAVPFEFDVEFRLPTNAALRVERHAHQLLNNYRVAPNREFFEVDTATAVEAAKEAAFVAGGIDYWSANSPTMVKAGDHVVLHPRGNDLFIIVYFPDALRTAAWSVLDIWQAHSDGDMLELHGMHSPEEVSGFAPGDIGCDFDPIPHLNRDQDVPNLPLFGKERLQPGTRLVWTDSRNAGASSVNAVFEIDTWTQVLARTHRIQLASPAMPLLLNTLTVDLGAGQIKSVREAAALGIPRTWSPAYPDAPAEYGSRVPERDRWVPQFGRSKK